MRLKGPLRAIWGFHARNINNLNDRNGVFKSRTAKSVSVASKLLNLGDKDKQKRITDYDIKLENPDTSEKEPLKRTHIHEVEFIQQGHVNLCGDACLEMLRLYNGEEPHREVEVNSKSLKSLSSNPRRAFQGLSREQLTKEIESSNFQLSELKFRTNVSDDKFTSDLADCIEQGPVLIAYRGNPFWGHYALIIGIIGDDLVIHNPWSGANEVKPVSWLQSLAASDKLQGYLSEPKGSLFAPSGCISKHIDINDILSKIQSQFQS